MPADSSREIRFVRVEVMRVARWEFNSGQSGPIEAEVVGGFLIKPEIAQKGSIANACFAAVRAGLAVIAVNHRQVELHADAVVDIEANEKLGGEAVDVFRIRIRRIAATRLK